MAEPVGTTLNLLDIIVTGVVGFGMYKGYKKGVLKEGIGVVAIFLAITFGYRYTSMFEPWLQANIDLPDKFIPILSFAGVFVVFLIIASFVLKFVDELLTKVFLGGINHALGALFGGFKYAFITSLVLLVLGLANIPSPNSVRDSLTYPYIKNFSLETARYALRLLPVARDKAKDLEQLLKDDPQYTDKDNSNEIRPRPPAVIQDPKPTPIR